MVSRTSLEDSLVRKLDELVVGAENSELVLH
jgi:hypothetical protein